MMSWYLCNRCELTFSPREAKLALIIVRLQEEIRKLLEELEEIDEIRAYDEAKANPGKMIPFEQAIAEIEKKRK